MKQVLIFTFLILTVYCYTYSQTPDEQLLKLCSNGPDDVTQLNSLIAQGAKINLKDPVSGSTPLIFASLNCYENLVKALLENHALPDIINFEGETALTITSIAKCEDSRYFHFIDTTNNKVAKENLSIRIIDMLLFSGANINKPNIAGMTPLMIASREGKCRLVEFLIKKGANVNYKPSVGFVNWTALRLATRNGYLECVKLLVNAKADINVYDNSFRTPLVHAVLNGDLEIVKFLLESGADPNPDPEKYESISPIIIAASSNKLEILKELIKFKANPNVHEKGLDIDKTPLYYANENKNSKMINVLKKAGALDSLIELEKNLISAAGKDDLKAVKKLISIGVSPFAYYETPDSIRFGKTPLSMAIENNSISVLKYLLTFKYPITMLDSILRSAKGKSRELIEQYIKEEKESKK